MKLPNGVTFNQSAGKRLIAKGAEDQEAIISIASTPGNAHYIINDRDFNGHFKRLFSDDYHDFDRRYHLLGDRKERLPVYSGAQYGSEAEVFTPKLPNLTVLPNVLTSQTRMVSLVFEYPQYEDAGKKYSPTYQMPTGQEVTLFGCSMGHWHGQANCPDGVQEIYEFQSYGALLIDRPESPDVELWVARDGDKVRVPQQCHMTLYNLDDIYHPLVTVDFANPMRNSANKVLVKRIGPILLAYYTAHEAVLVLNANYINRVPEPFIEPAAPNAEPPDDAVVDNRRCLHGGVRISQAAASHEGRVVRIPLGTRASLGEQLYESLTADDDVIVKLARLGIRVRRASSEISIGGVWYSRPLVEAVQYGCQLYHHFLPADLHDPQPEEPVSSAKGDRPLHEGEKAWSGQGPRMLDPGRQEGERIKIDIPLLIEGSGDWVENAYVPVLKDILKDSNAPGFTVVVADDSRWYAPAATRPVLPDLYPKISQMIKDGELVFLDKAYPPHYERYRNLNPRVVIVVTPDYTHSTICRENLDRASTIFVEKPFDANSRNVAQLITARGLAKRDTEIYALDHYRFVAWQLKENTEGGVPLLEKATEWLGGRIQEVRFCMTENKPVEPNRVRALQYGLMLDLLPHCFAMLAFFGKLDSIDELRLLSVGRYLGAPIAKETFAHVKFSFEDYSDSGLGVPCEAWVGKGLKHTRKYFEVKGVSGNSVLIVFGNETLWPSQNDPIKGGIHFVEEGKAPALQKALPEQRYGQLIRDLVHGTRKAIVCAMPLQAGERIVHSLDRLWSAIQIHSPWFPYELGELDILDSAQ